MVSGIMKQILPRFLAKFLGTILAAGAGFVLAASAASAHPHVWVIAKSSVVYAPDGSIVGMRHSWAFDDMYSTFATQGLDQKTKGEFTREELQPLAQVNVESLKDFDFFTYAKLDGKKAVFAEPMDYHLEFNSKDTVLTLHFMLPLKTPVKAKSVSFEVFDPSYFVDFQFAAKDAAALVGAPAGCELNLGKPQELTKELVQKLAEIPPGGQIPENSYGAAFANKIQVKCP
jgi:ABC-type uncharacterized transport system substrate-binding protein